MKSKKSFFHYLLDFLWELWCLVSVIGIWPRYIEPKVIFKEKVTLKDSKIDKELRGFKVLQFSDLHYFSKLSASFLKRLSRKINTSSADLIVFTGDFLCFSQYSEDEKLKNFLSSLNAPFGRYYVYGNHDYSSYVTLKDKQAFISEEKIETNTILLKLARRIKLIKDSKGKPLAQKQVHIHSKLHSLLHDLGWRCLENESVIVRKGKASFNLCGLGDIWAEKFDPEKAFKNYKKELPGIVLCHNPMAFDILKNYPGEIILSGHTHGGQVNLPLFWRLQCSSVPSVYKSGYFSLGQKKLYVSRGVGSTVNFRWFSPPELTEITFEVT